MSNQYIICGIGTDCGKSVVSVLLYDYLKKRTKLEPILVKPVQTGAALDTDFYQACQINRQNIFNFYTMTLETSVHTASHLAEKTIDVDQMVHETVSLQTKNRPLLLEMAGGLMSPINETTLMIDFVEALQLPVIVVVDNYLGAINHALLTTEALKNRGIPIAGLINNTSKKENAYDQTSLEIIASYTGLSVIGRVPYLTEIEDQLTELDKKSELVKEWQLNVSQAN